MIFERWRHIHGCARFFNAVRDTVTDKFVMTYKAGEPKPDLSKAATTRPRGLGQSAAGPAQCEEACERQAASRCRKAQDAVMAA